MTASIKWLRAAGVYLSVKGVVFLGLAALGLTALPPLLLAGLSMTWLVGGVAMFGIIRRVKRLTAPEPEPAPEATPERAINTKPAPQA